VEDTAPDLYWRDGIANASITAEQARTSATLELPPGAKVKYARLYWAALKQGDQADTSVVLDRLYGPQVVVTADATSVIPFNLPAHPDWYYYQATGDVSAFVATLGAGDYRVTGIEAVPLANLDYEIHRNFSAWTLVVFYELPGEDLRNLALFDAFEWVDPGLGQPEVSVLLSGFLVPSGFDAHMTVFAYEGDQCYTGDTFIVNGTPVGNALNPADNFFNGTRTFLCTAVSGSKDVPKLSGEPGTMAGYDLDTVDVTSLLKVGDTKATVGARSSKDIFMLGGFVTSIRSLSPDFAGSTKSAADLNGGGVKQGDIIEYTIRVTNGGNDTSVNTRLTDTLDPKLEYVRNSITVDGVAKTDASGDDTAEYNPATRTITVRLGEGATATAGGKIKPGASSVVRFRAKVLPASGSIQNQGVIKAAGEAGCEEQTWYTDGDTAIGTQPTVVTVNECETDADCPMTKPHCDPATHTCQPCKTDADCPDSRPACQPDGSCGECSATNQTRCVAENPVCDTVTGTCVPCIPGPSGNAGVCSDDPNGTACVRDGDEVRCGCYTDADCGDAQSGRVCDTTTNTCVDGCRGESGNGCPAGYQCTSTDTTIGVCQPVGPAAVSDQGAGCGGCRVPPRSSSLGVWAILALAFLLMRRRQG